MFKLRELKLKMENGTLVMGCHGMRKTHNAHFLLYIIKVRIERDVFYVDLEEDLTFVLLSVVD